MTSKNTGKSPFMAFLFSHMEPQDSTRNQLVLRWDGQEKVSVPVEIFFVVD